MDSKSYADLRSKVLTCFSGFQMREKQGCDMSTWVWVRLTTQHPTAPLSVSQQQRIICSTDCLWRWVGFTKSGLTSRIFYTNIYCVHCAELHLHNWAFMKHPGLLLHSFLPLQFQSVHIVSDPSASNGAKLLLISEILVVTDLFEFDSGWTQTENGFFLTSIKIWYHPLDFKFFAVVGRIKG